MILRNFEYYSPNSLSEACKLLEENGEGARALAGGQSLIPIMKLGLADIACIVDLKRIPDLSYIRREGTELAIGSLVTHTEVSASELVSSQCPLLSETARKIGHVQIRNRGTMGGSLCHSDTSADYPPTMLTLNARFVAQRSDGKTRIIKASDFFKGIFSTSLEKGELLKEVRIPIPPAGSKYSFQKLMMPKGGFALVLVSTMINFQGNFARSAAVSIGGVTETPFRATQIEENFVGKTEGDLNERVIATIVAKALENVKLSEGLDYPIDLVSKLMVTTTKRSIVNALGSGRH